MISMIIASIDAITEVIFTNTFARNDLLWFNWIFNSSNDCWNSVGYPLSNYCWNSVSYPLSNDIFYILPSHILIPRLLLRLINLINWFITSIFHLIIYLLVLIIIILHKIIILISYNTHIAKLIDFLISI
ncbi:hypothetical protein Hanom_Chr07g00605341 [Helianthus anomalus]